MHVGHIKPMVMLALCLVGLPNLSEAFLGLGKDGEKEVPSAKPHETEMLRRYHLHVPNKKTEKELMDLLTSKQLFLEDIKVLQRLERARLAQALRLQNRLLNEYRIQPTVRYEFDRDNGALFQVNATTNGVEKVQIKTIGDPATRGRLTRILDGKNKLNHQIKALRDVLADQRRRAERTEQLLSDKFSLIPDHIYQYDEKEMVLYEVLPASQVNQ